MGSILYRDFLHKVTEVQFRSARLSVWFDTPKDFFFAENAKFKAAHGTLAQDVLPAAGQTDAPEKKPLKVFTDSELLKSRLTSVQFEAAAQPEEADVLWVESSIIAKKKYTPYSHS